MNDTKMRRKAQLLMLLLLLLMAAMPAFANDYSAAGIDNSAKFDSFYTKLCANLKANNRAGVAALFKYPMSVHVPKGAFGTEVDLASQTQLINRFDVIFPPELIKTLLKTPTSELWARDVGVATPSGDIWFNADGNGFTITTVNVASSAIKLSSVTVPKGFPTYVFGSYTINEVKSVAGHIDVNKNLNTQVMGKHFVLTPESATFDANIDEVGTSCQHPKYELKIGKTPQEGWIRQEGTLDYYGLPSKRPPLTIAANCGNDVALYMEIAKDNRLARYYDGWMIYAKKAATPAK